MPFNILSLRPSLTVRWNPSHHVCEWAGAVSFDNWIPFFLTDIQYKCSSEIIVHLDIISLNCCRKASYFSLNLAVLSNRFFGFTRLFYFVLMLGKISHFILSSFCKLASNWRIWLVIIPVLGTLSTVLYLTVPPLHSSKGMQAHLRY